MHNNASSQAVRGETGRHPFIIRQKIKLLKYWRKITVLPDESLLKKMYVILCDLNDGGYKTWATHVEEVLKENQLEHLWNEQCIEPREIQTVSNILYSNYDNLWMRNINDVTMNPKLRTYCTFKSCFVMEPYLMSILDYDVRKQLTRFRISNHVLYIEQEVR